MNVTKSVKHAIKILINNQLLLWTFKCVCMLDRGCLNREQAEQRAVKTHKWSIRTMLETGAIVSKGKKPR